MRSVIIALLAAMLMLAACSGAPADQADVAPDAAEQGSPATNEVPQMEVSEDVEELDLEIDPSEFDY